MFLVSYYNLLSVHINLKELASFLGIDIDFFNDIWDQYKLT